MATEDKKPYYPFSEPNSPPAKKCRSGRVSAQFLYKNGDNFVLMDEETYGQIEFTPAWLGPSAKFFREGQDGFGLIYIEDFIVSIESPSVIEARVESIILDADSKKSSLAVLDNGAELDVPLTVKTGDTVKINTKTGTFAGLVI